MACSCRDLATNREEQGRGAMDEELRVLAAGGGGGDWALPLIQPQPQPPASAAGHRLRLLPLRAAWGSSRSPTASTTRRASTARRLQPPRVVFKDEVYPEGTHLIVPLIERPVICNVRARPNLVESTSGSRDLQMVTFASPDPSTECCSMLIYSLRRGLAAESAGQVHVWDQTQGVCF
ncbi:uncharacterized protein LOC124664569 [Lolium rigidum]|uniref:uncharacterized protein LOC124664569 n=1 Tax=Lolium rigidum TaxID=89674 RepID=UPI001F5CB948|nr:uncharacterized protein LOC124664569 [Lolium rigidum]